MSCSSKGCSRQGCSSKGCSRPDCCKRGPSKQVSHNRDKAWFLASLQNRELVEKLQKIKLIISDIDGCLTSGKVFYSGDDHIQKAFSIQDGFMMAKCNKPGMPHLALVSGRSDEAARKRAKHLGIPDDLYCYGIDKNKSQTMKEIQKKLSVQKEETICFGDDLLDVETKECCGLFASPANALFYIQDNADIVTPRRGADGALRLLLDLLLYVQQKHYAQELIKNSLQ